MTREDLPAPREGFVLTHYLTASDVDRSRDFYADVLGGQVVLERNPAMIKVANTWIIINEGGGPTPDKPDVTLAPPSDPTKASSFLNIRVADIEACYDEWSAKGAEFLTAPIDRGPEIRCYMRDPDGYLIEVGQSTRLLERGCNLRNQKEEPDERGRVGVFAARKRRLHRVGGYPAGTVLRSRLRIRLHPGNRLPRRSSYVDRDVAGHCSQRCGGHGCTTRG